MKVLVIISSDNLDVAKTGLMWAINAIRNKWVDDVEVIFFGPIERAIAEGNRELIELISSLVEARKQPLACRRIAEVEGYLEKLEDKIQTIYVGSRIAELMSKGYIPLVF
ncbi:MAG: hypothetical protein F7C81_00465 [Desulfurococcales archaeon]|nr:hypothetical protein [Desulfurococcales archaeon]